MVNTRQQLNKSKPNGSEKTTPTALKKAKPEPKSKPKAVRFTGAIKKKPVVKSEPKNDKHQSRSSHRDRNDGRGRGSRRSSSSRKNVGHHDFSFPYGVQSAGVGYGPGPGPGYDWRFGAMSPFGYFNYPNINPAEFGRQQHHGSKDYYSQEKRRRESSSSSDESTELSLVASSDSESDDVPEVYVPAKRTARSKSMSADAPPTRPRGRPKSHATPKSPANHTVVSGGLNAFAPAKRSARALSVKDTTAPAMPRGRPRLSATTTAPSANHTVVSGALLAANKPVTNSLSTPAPAPAKRTARSLSMASIANRIKTPDMQPLGRVKFTHNSLCICSMCVPSAKPNVPWMQSVPRFSVIDNHQRPVPNLAPILASVNPSASASASASPSVAASMNSDESQELLEVQMKLNTELMQRVDTLEAEKKVLEDNVQMLQAECDRSKKQALFYKSKWDTSLAENIKPKVGNRDRDANVDSSASKENMSNNTD